MKTKTRRIKQWVALSISDPPDEMIDHTLAGTESMCWSNARIALGCVSKQGASESELCYVVPCVVEIPTKERAKK